jgi:serine O-acetyltransferase
VIHQDFGRYVKSKNSLNWFWIFMSSPGYRFMIFYRVCNKTSKSNPIGLLARIWYKRLQVKYGYQIPFTAKIGKGLFLGHFGNIVINQGVSMGENCNIAQGVTLGYISVGDKKGCPKIGDRVWIGANAVVVGNISIGNDVLIAPLTFVNFDVPEGSTVMGNPGKIINSKGSAGYIKNLVEN